MPSIEVNGKSIEVDEDGFIIDLSQWDEDVARYLAKETFKEVNPAVRYLGIRASIILKDVPKNLNNKVCFNENHEGYELVSEFL